ncbi:MAG: hypothetical protein ACOYO1_10700 [Bacteroidales bacterium]|jgi:hypothetical protein
MRKIINLKIFIILAIVVVLITSCASEKRIKKKKCKECPTFSYILKVKYDRA